MPNALMEAMACGLPCISTDFAGGAVKILIEDGKNGLIVPVGDRVSMADAIRRILDSNDLADYLANNAIKIKEQLAPEIIYDKWEQILNDVMSR